MPFDNVDAEALRRPVRWNIKFIERFMLVLGPVSSLFDFLTFFALLSLFGAGEAMFQTGWFIESLATQCLVIFVIRTRGAPWRSLPHPLLTCLTLGVGPGRPAHSADAAWAACSALSSRRRASTCFWSRPSPPICCSSSWSSGAFYRRWASTLSGSPSAIALALVNVKAGSRAKGYEPARRRADPRRRDPVGIAPAPRARTPRPATTSPRRSWRGSAKCRNRCSGRRVLRVAI